MTFDLKKTHIMEMTPKADLSCRKTYKKWYYIIFYFKNELRYSVFMVILAAILSLSSRVHQRSRPILFAIDFENTMPIPNTMPNFKNLSPSARLFQILGYSSPATKIIYLYMYYDRIRVFRLRQSLNEPPDHIVISRHPLYIRHAEI